MAGQDHILKRLPGWLKTVAFPGWIVLAAYAAAWYAAGELAHHVR